MSINEAGKTFAEVRYKNYGTKQLFRLIDKLERKNAELFSDLDKKEGIPAFEKICRLQNELDSAYIIVGHYRDWHREHTYTVHDGPFLHQKSYSGEMYFDPKNPQAIPSSQKG